MFYDNTSEDKRIMITAGIALSTSGDKLASGIPEEDKEYYDNIFALEKDFRQHPKDEFALILAVTPWEYFGPNANGDALFSKPFFYIKDESTLPKTCGSLVTRAMLSRNHKYDDPDTCAIGETIQANYNEKYKRVEVFARYDWVKAPSECSRLRRKSALLTSMGYRIYAADLPSYSGEFCSFCGKHARVPSQRCSHLSSQNNAIIQGIPVFMMNGHGYFVDLSSIVIPGDMNSRTILRLTDSEEK